MTAAVRAFAPHVHAVTPRMAHALLALIAILALCTATARAADVPYLSGRVVDEAEIISPAVRDALTRTLKDYEDANGTQVVVLTIAGLAGDSIEDFSQRAFDQWKLGQKGKDNGVLVVVAPKDRRMRIHVGYGLEGSLTDVVASRIIRNVMTPRFKDNDYDRGIQEGVDAIIAQLQGRPGSAAESSTSSQRHGTFGSFEMTEPEIAWPMRILLGAFIFGVIGVFTVVGVMTPGMGWFLYVFLIPFWAMFPIIVVGVKGALALLVTYVVAFPIAKIWVSHRPWYEKAARDLRTTGQASVGGMVFSTGGGSSSGADGGGGFSGGGGSSGGGGASGSW